MNYKPTRFFLILLCVFPLLTNAAPDELRQLYQQKTGTYPLRTQHLLDNGEPTYVNELIKQTSPYLLQHAHNPVNWLPWGEAAFALARKQDKPVFLSVGYSTCHWCHVMERESFEDEQIASFINQHFIAIKVDREEHPDVDEVYLTAVQMLSGKVGWPLTAVLTPEADAFFGATYLPPEQLLPLLNKISDTWQQRRSAVLEQANRTTQALHRRNQQAKDSKKINQAVLESAGINIASDLFAPPKYNTPGFPREPEMLFLLQQLYRDMNSDLTAKLVSRLSDIARGGIHDHLGGGFHRYSVDSQWRVPHFEKMLYNQAQMGEVYARAYQLAGDRWLLDTATRTFDYILASLQAPEGGFYSAMDAESGGMEGGYYVWAYQTLSELLSEAQLAQLKAHYDVTERGNFEGHNVLILKPDVAVNAVDTQPLLASLADARQQRVAPATDTKIITAWNGMTISALLTGFRATHNEHWKAAALKAATRIWERSWNPKQGLARTIPNQGHRINGALDDYAFFALALLELYDLTDDPAWLTRSQTIAEQMIDSFYDEQKNGFYISRTDTENALMVPLISARDDAITSGNSAATQLLAKLYRRTGETHYRTIARGVISRFSNKLINSPQSLSGMLLAASFLNTGETGPVQYAAKGNVRVAAHHSGQSLTIEIDIQPGWHVNANEVLQNYLIPTRISSPANGCAQLSKVEYPKGKLTSLGFQKEQLSVYEGKVAISAKLDVANTQQCKMAAITMKIQGCTDEVCASPETLTIRTGLH